MLDDEAIEEVGSAFQLKELKEKLHRLEAENKQFKLHNQFLNIEYSSAKQTHQSTLKAMGDQLNDVWGKMQDYEVSVREKDQIIAALRRDHAEQQEADGEAHTSSLNELTTRFDEVCSQLEEVRTFIKNKEEIDAELAGLRVELQKKAEERDTEVGELYRTKAVEIEELKKVMVRKIKETRDLLRAKTRDQLDATTKRTIMENEQLTTELQIQSRETERLVERNTALVEEVRQLKRHLTVHQDLENELARRTHVYQKLIGKLHLKMQQMTTEQSTSEQMASKDSRGSALQEEELVRLRKETASLQSTIHVLRREYAQYKHDHATATQLQDQSTRLIVAALYDLRNEFLSSPEFPPLGYAGDDSEFANMDPVQREYFFRMLLERLNQSLCTTCVPAGPASSFLGPVSSFIPAMHGSVAPGGSMTLGPDAPFSDILHSLSASAMPMRSELRADMGCQTEPSGLVSRSVEQSFEVVRGPVRDWGSKINTPRRRNFY